MRFHYCALVSMLMTMTVDRSFAQVQRHHVDLAQLGWHIAGDNQPLLYNALGFSADRSLWALYPSENTTELVPRNEQPVHRAVLVHLSESGAVLATCSISLPDWSHVGLFVNKDDNVVIQAGASFQLVAGCQVKTKRSLDEMHSFRTELSSGRDVLFVTTNDNRLIAVDSQTLATIFDRALPGNARLGEITLAQNIAVLPIPEGSRDGCESQNIIKMRLSNSLQEEWTHLTCSEVVAFSDESLLATRRSSDNEVLTLIDEHGVVQSSFPTEHGWFVDTPSFYLRRFSRPPRRRIAEYLFEKGGFAGWFFRSSDKGMVEVIDLKGGHSVLQVREDHPSPVFSFTLSSKGDCLAVMSDGNLDIYNIPY
jgi:WD40 repeat protein